MMFGALSTACSKPGPNPTLVLEALPEEVFLEEAEYQDEMKTIGDLGQGYLVNTTALRRANNKIRTLCIASGRCERGKGT